jgi:glycosyltransferase involved in cell wall biosynthesis
MLPAGSRFYAIDNPVDARYGPRVAAERNGAYVYVGRLSAEKGGALFAEAARRLGLPIVFVGNGSERAEIARVYPGATFVGWLDREGVKAQLEAARCVVVPSVWYETLGLVVLEAAALGIPAVVPTGTAAYDLIAPGRSGLSFERGNVDELTERLRAVASDDALVERMSRNAYAAYWKAPLTMSLHVDRLLSVYASVLRGAPAVVRPRSTSTNQAQDVIAERSA